WEPHRGTWISWPHKEKSWPGLFAAVPNIIAAMVRELQIGEEVHINVRDAAMEAEARQVLRDAAIGDGNVFFHHFPTNDAWCRDHGPIFVQRERRGTIEQMVIDWEFNAWGGKYPPYDLDNQIPGRIAHALDIERVVPRTVLEGGSIGVNGAGTLLTTESCLLNRNRNPAFTRPEIEQELRDHLGVSHILWLG